MKLVFSMMQRNCLKQLRKQLKTQKKVFQKSKATTAAMEDFNGETLGTSATSS